MPQVLERPVVEAEAEFEDGGFDAEAAHTQYILDALAEAEEYEARPDAMWYTSEEVWQHLDEAREQRRLAREQKALGV